jgi:hypothetical protein
LLHILNVLCGVYLVVGFIFFGFLGLGVLHSFFIYLFLLMDIIFSLNAVSYYCIVFGNLGYSLVFTLYNANFVDLCHIAI